MVLIACRANQRIEENNEEDEEVKFTINWLKHFRVYFWISMIMTFLTWVAWAAIPTKKDCLLIVAGGGAMNFLTTDSSAKQLPHEAMNYVVTELRTMAAEAKVDMGISKQKDKVIEEAKSLTGAELIERLKSDSTLAKIILQQ